MKFFILVLYNCKLSASKTYQSIVNALKEDNETGYLYIYDNSRVSQIIENHDGFWSGLHYVHDANNSGISLAYNAGAEYAERMAFEWIILLDQDTQFNVNYISELNRMVALYPDVVLFAPILNLQSGKPFSPSRYQFKRGHSIQLSPGFHSLDKYSPVNSGMMISLRAFKDVGGYVNNVKLDFADFQFIERLRKRFTNFYLINSVGIQDFSNDEPNIEKSIVRFKIYLTCAGACIRESKLDNLLYFYSVFRHTLGLSIKFKSFKFTNLFYQFYIKTNK